MKFSFARRGVLVALATIGSVTALAFAGGIAYASIPDSGGVIHTCFSKATATWRPIDQPSQQCKNNETALDIYSKTGADSAFVNNGDAAGGDLTGTYPNPTIDNAKVTTDKIANGAITTSKFDGLAKAPNADKLDNLDSSDFAGAGTSYSKADSDARFLGITAKAADSEKLDGKDASAFALAGSMPNTYVRTAESHVSALSQGSVDVYCDSGDRLLSGGYHLGSDLMNTLDDRPSTNNNVSYNGWLVNAVNGALGERQLITYVLCADVA